MESFRAHSLEVERRAPVLRLVAVNTVEHVKLFLPPKSSHYLDQLISYAAILREQAGSLPEMYLENFKSIPTDIAKTVIHTAKPGMVTEFKIPNVPGLPIYETASQQSLKQPSAASSQSSEHPSIVPPSTTPALATTHAAAVAPAQHAGEKRRWEEVENSTRARWSMDTYDLKTSGRAETQVMGSPRLPDKKRRVDENVGTPSVATPNMDDITRITDSQPNRTQAPETTLSRRTSMDIDQPEPQVIKPNSAAPVAPSQREPQQVDAPIPDEPEDSPVALPIRERESDDADCQDGPDKQGSDKQLVDPMEDVAYG